MKSLKPTLLSAMLSGIFQGFIIVAIITAIIKQDAGYLIFAGFSVLCAGMVWGVSYDRAVELRAWIDPAKELEFLQFIPQDAVDRQWIKEIEEAYNSYNYQNYGADPLAQAKIQINQADKHTKIVTLLYAAKAARGIRLPKQVTIRSDD